jgi:ribosomal protein S18 acetylase RimI-like enzyme
MLNLPFRFRKAKVSDIDELEKIENQSFSTDRISRRSFFGFFLGSSSVLFVALDGRILIGYGLVLYKKGSSLARLYSIAVAQKYKGKGFGTKILNALEEAAVARNAAYMRLEVANSNVAAISLYQSLGYYKFDVKEDYYESHEDALCFEKILISPNSKTKKNRIRYYRQTTDFTCGPAALMMAMNAHRPSLKLTQSLELQLWREATTIFMLSGHGGCGPRGLALAAAKRNFKADLFVSPGQFLFLNSVRDVNKQEIIKLVQKDFDKQLRKFRIKGRKDKVNFELVATMLNRGGIPLVLISAYQLTQNKTPHWIVVSGIDDKFIYFNDPNVEDGETVIENQNIPVRKDEFNRMCRYGSQQVQAMVVLFKKSKV